MKKILVITIAIILITLILTLTLPTSAKNDKEVLYEAALTGPFEVIVGNVIVYDDFQAVIEFEDNNAPNEEYEFLITYGVFENRKIQVFPTTIIADENGKGEGYYDLTTIPPLFPGGPKILTHPGFAVRRPNPGGPFPYIHFSTDMIIFRPPPPPPS